MTVRILFLFACIIGSLFSAAQGTVEEAKMLNREGNNHLSRFESEQALAKFNRVIEIAKLRKNDFLLARGYLGAGQAIWYQSRFSGAIDSMNRAIALLRTFSKKDGDLAIPSALRILSNIYDETGDYEKAFQTISEALQANSPDDSQNFMLCIIQLAELYLNIGDYRTALEFFHQADQKNPQLGTYEFRELNTQIGRLYSARGMYDSARYFYRKSVPGHPFPRNVYLRIGESYLFEKRYDSARFYILPVYNETKSIHEAATLLPATIALGETYIASNRDDSALILGKEALALATEKSKRQNKRDALLLLSKLYEKRNDRDEAYIYYRQYVALKDSVLSEQFKGRLYTFRQQQDEIAQRAELEILKSRQRTLKTSLMVIAAASIFVILVLVLRYKNKNLQLQRRSSELEMQALRAQMNPHFIFNCMSAINHFILNRETDKASDYLTRFSRLIRLVLVNSEKTTVTLEEELQMLKLYLEMEQLRFAHAFEYRISYDKTIHPPSVIVPSFILQPFCENAIWHGLLHKDGPGMLTIDFKAGKEMISCVITDNGIGRTRAAEIKKRKTEEHVPFGHKLVAERLSLFNNGKSKTESFVIDDLLDENGEIAGTRVTFSFANPS